MDGWTESKQIGKQNKFKYKLQDSIPEKFRIARNRRRTGWQGGGRTTRARTA